MAFYRQLLVFTVPPVAVLLGIYWYRCRRGFGKSDPGGNIRNKKTLKQELEEAVEQAKIHQNHSVSPTKLIVKSSPIDIIPNGMNSQKSSPIHLTDKELDMEIERVISQKNSGIDMANKRNSKENTPPMAEKHPKSLPIEVNAHETKSRVSSSVRHEAVVSCLTDQLLQCKLNEENQDSNYKVTNSHNQVISSNKLSISPIKEKIKEEHNLDKSSPHIYSDECKLVQVNNDSSNVIECEIDEEIQIKTEHKPLQSSKINKNNNIVESKLTISTKTDKSLNKSNKKSRKNSTDKKSNVTDKKQSNGSEKKHNLSIDSVENGTRDSEVKDNEPQIQSDDSNKEKDHSVDSSDINAVHNRDSANHSPSDAMLASPSIGHFSDNHSEGSNDSGKGCSESPSPPPTNAGDVNQMSNYTCHQFAISKSTTGFLIGVKHSFIIKLNSATGARVYIRDHPECPKYNVCVIEGIQQDIDIVLDMIKQKLPDKRFHVSFRDITAEICKSDYSLLAENYNITLVEGVNNDVIISCYVNPSQLFLQQPMHPTYPSLHILHTMMGVCYQDPKVPKLPSIVTEGMICAAPTANNWYRTQVIMTNPETDTSLVKLLDFGGFMDINNSLLKQIRHDFMYLPFQAIEVQLANVIPVDGGEWSPDAVQVIAGLTSGQLLQAQIVGYNEDGLPQVNLYLILGPQQVILLNHELVVRGLAERYEQEF